MDKLLDYIVMSNRATLRGTTTVERIQIQCTLLTSFKYTFIFLTRSVHVYSYTLHVAYKYTNIFLISTERTQQYSTVVHHYYWLIAMHSVHLIRCLLRSSVADHTSKPWRPSPKAAYCHQYISCCYGVPVGVPKFPVLNRCDTNNFVSQSRTHEIVQWISQPVFCIILNESTRWYRYESIV